MREICIAGRGSKLATAQNELVKALLEKQGYKVRIMTVSTRGDRDRKTTVTALGGNGPFVRDVEKVLLSGEADIAVHCVKDLPYETAPGLIIAGIPDAADPRDCLLMRKSAGSQQVIAGMESMGQLAAVQQVAESDQHRQAAAQQKAESDSQPPTTAQQNAHRNSAPALPARPLVIGTGSPRRIKQLEKLYAGHVPGIVCKDIRGNITTRLDKLRRGEFDGIVLAKAGLDRIGAELQDFDVRVFEPEEMIPAVGQGLLACECREDDAEMRALLAKLTPSENALRYQMERDIFCRFRCDCRAAVGIYAKIAPAGAELLIMYEEERS